MLFSSFQEGITRQVGAKTRKAKKNNENNGPYVSDLGLTRLCRSQQQLGQVLVLSSPIYIVI